MSSSRYVWDDVAQRRMARPHDPDGTPIDNNKSTPAESHGTDPPARCSRRRDFATFIINVIDPKPADAARLKPESVAEMLRPHVKLPASEFPSSWALGWQSFTTRPATSSFTVVTTRGFIARPWRPWRGSAATSR